MFRFNNVLRTLFIALCVCSAYESRANLMQSEKGADAKTAIPMTDAETRAYFTPDGATQEQVEKGLTIVYDGFRRSSIEMCSCATNPLGGYDRQAKVMELLDQSGAARSYVDAGGFLRDAPAGSNPAVCSIPDEFLTKTLTLMQMYQMEAVDAVNVGFMDMGAGIGFLKKMQSDYKIPFISANIVDASTKEKLFAPYVVVEKKLSSGKIVKVGYLGISRNNAYPGLPESLLKGQSYRVEDEVKTMKEYLPKLRKEADLVVVLLYARRTADYAKKYITALTDEEKPDLVICSEFFGMIKDVENIGKSMIICSGYEGRNIGNLLVTFDAAGLPLKCYNKLIDLRPNVPAVSTYTKIMEAILSEIRPKPAEIKKIQLD